jgi:hypothetical protein
VLLKIERDTPGCMKIMQQLPLFASERTRLAAPFSRNTAPSSPRLARLTIVSAMHAYNWQILQAYAEEGEFRAKGRNRELTLLFVTFN